MSKWYEVKVTGFTTVMVEVEDNEDGQTAEKWALDAASDFDLDFEVESGGMIKKEHVRINQFIATTKARVPDNATWDSDYYFKDFERVKIKIEDL